MKKYSWDFNGDAERWGNDTHDTIEDCIADAKRAIAERDYQTKEAPKVVFIGTNEPFAPWVDPEAVLDRLEEQASEFAGEAGDDWDAYNPKKEAELNELAESLTSVVIEWLEKYGYTPEFYAIHNIKPYQL